MKLLRRWLLLDSLRIYVGEPEVRYDPRSGKLVIRAGNFVVLVRLERVLEALGEQDVYCKCYRD